MRVVLLVVLVLAMCSTANARVLVNAHEARSLAREFLAWEKHRGYTTEYHVGRCRGRLPKGGLDWLPTWGVKAYCRTYRNFTDPPAGKVWDIFTVNVEHVHRHCRFWGSTYLLLSGIDENGREWYTPDHYVYRRCPTSGRGNAA